MTYFTQAEVEAFFRHDLNQIDDYVRLLNAHAEMSPRDAFDAALELLATAPDDDGIALVGVEVLEAIVDRYYQPLMKEIESALRTDRRFRLAFGVCSTASMPESIRAHLDEIAAQASS